MKKIFKGKKEVDTFIETLKVVSDPNETVGHVVERLKLFQSGGIIFLENQLSLWDEKPMKKKKEPILIKIGFEKYLGCLTAFVTVDEKIKYYYTLDTAYKEKIDRFKTPLQAFNFIKKNGLLFGTAEV